MVNFKLSEEMKCELSDHITSHFLTDPKIYHLYLSHTRRFDIADPSSTQDGCHT